MWWSQRACMQPFLNKQHLLAVLCLFGGLVNADSLYVQTVRQEKKKKREQLAGSTPVVE